MNINKSYPIKAVHGIEVNTSMPCHSSNYYSYSSRNVKYIVMHYTGNSKDTAKANASYFNSGSRGASAHYFVDDANCYQSVALNNAAWAVGGTKQYKHSDCRNLNSVSIEMCCSGGYAVSERTEINAAHLCAELCWYIGITADEVDTYVLRHWDVWAKSCPANWTGNGNARWNGFKAKVKAILRNESEGLTMTQYEELKSLLEAQAAKYDSIINKMGEEIAELKEIIEDPIEFEEMELASPMIYDYIDENMPEWAREGVQWCVDNGIINGTGEGLGLDDKDLKYCTIIMRMANKFIK